MRTFLLALATVAIVVVVALAAHGPRVALVPRCVEDAVLVGLGDFEAGTWSSYECGPAADDFTR